MSDPITDKIAPYVIIAGWLLNAATATVEAIRAIFRQAGLSEEEVNAILAAVEADAAKRRDVSKAIAQADGDSDDAA